tara:strand:+ start:1056 stop:1283 length:228 start_codon:yes stop_codon:yes gene_type:complete
MRWKKKIKIDNGLVPKLINYIPEQIEQIKEVASETDYSFTEVQKMINSYFFEDEDNVDDVFGESEDEIFEDDDEE